MKNNKFIKALIVAVSCLLLVGVAFGVVAVAESTDSGASTAQIVYKNVAHKGAPGLVYYVKTDSPLAEGQKIKLLFWEGEDVDGIYSVHNSTYSKYAEQEVSIDGATYYAVVAEGVAPSEVRKTLIAQPLIVSVDAEGNETTTYSGSLLHYSIFDYVIDMLSKQDGAAKDQEKLYTALLDYAAAIQEVLFTNSFNGKINTTKLEAVGGWADAYYVIQLNRYLYSTSTGKYAAEGKYVRYFARSTDEPVNVDVDLYYNTVSSDYSFRGYRNMDDSYILENNSTVNTINGVSIGKSPLNSKQIVLYAKNLGKTDYKVLYGVKNASPADYDSASAIENFKTHSDFWAQYNVSTTETKDKLATTEIMEYYYEGKLVTYFYTVDGKISSNMNDYHYAAVKTTTDAEGKTTFTLATGTIAEADRASYTYVDVMDKTNPSIQSKAVEVYSKGYVDWVNDPLAAEGETTEHGKVMVVSKYIYDLDKKSNPDKAPYLDSVNVQNIGTNTSQNFFSKGYVYLLGHINVAADGKSGSNKIGGINAYINSVSPEVIYNIDHLPVHTFETDILVDAYTKDIVTQVYMLNGNTNLVQFDIVNCTQGGNEFYLKIESGPGKNGGRYDANGNSIGNVTAGSNGTVNAGGKLYHNTWYNLRVEYVAAGDKAIILTYIDDVLTSYIVDDATASSDDRCTKVNFFNLNASRKTHIYLDNTSISTDGCTAEQIQEEFNDFTEKYYQTGITHGGGLYFDKSAQVDKSYKPANGLSSNKVIVEEKLEDSIVNYALKIFKQNSTGGYSATVPVDVAGGNYYIFETDIKVIGSDNKTDWMLKFSFQNSNITAPSDTQEIMMPTIGYKDPGYWTFITNYSKHQAKFKLNEWHNIRFEYNPATEVLNAYVNGVEIDLGNIGRTSTNGVKNSNATFAGVSLNVRAKNATYTEILFDNMYATTVFSSSFANGENYTQSEKYDNYVPEDDNTVVVNDTEYKDNKYITTTGGKFGDAPINPLGHDYIFETDIRWNGISGFENIESTTSNIMSLKLYSETGEILSVDGWATDLDKSDLLLKIGTTTVATIVRDLWLNLKVVYTPGEVTDVDGTTTYSATYSICFNNAAIYTATVSGPDMENLKFDRAELVIAADDEALTPSISIDNTYVGTRYNDYYKKGENFANSDQIKVPTSSGSTTDTTEKVNGSSIFNPTLTIGTSYTFETDIKWIEGAGKIAMSGSDSEFFTIHIVPDANDARYANLVYYSTDENGETVANVLQSIHTGTWYNVQVKAKTVSVVVDEESGETRDACMFVVKVSGVERLSVEQKITTPFVKAIFTADVSAGIEVDNVFCDVLNSNYSGKGEYKGDAFGKYTDADKDGLFEYDKNFAETNPDGEFTDGYVKITNSQVTIGKGTAISNLIKFINPNTGATKHVFESDMNWGGTKNGIMEPIEGTDLAVYYTVTINGADGAELLTIYAVGAYSLDVAQPDIQFVQLYTSLDDIKNGESIAAISADVWHNLRVEYETDGDYTIFVNNDAVATGTGAASDTMSSVSIELGDKVYDTSLAIKYTCVTSVTVVEE